MMIPHRRLGVLTLGFVLLALGFVLLALGGSPLFADSAGQTIADVVLAGTDPVDVAVDDAGVVYVLDRTDAIARTFDLGLTPIGSIAVPDPAVPWTGIAHATSPDRLYWIDESGTQLAETAPNGTQPSIIALSPPPGTQVLGLTYEPVTGNLFYSDAGNSRAYEITTSGVSTGLSIESPGAIYPGVAAATGGIAAVPGSSCLDLGVGTFVEGTVTRRARVDTDGIVQSIEEWDLGAGEIRGHAFHAAGSTGTAVLYLATAAPSRLLEVTTGGACTPCPNGIVTGLSAAVVAGTDVELSWTPPPGADAIRVLRDGEGIATLPPTSTLYVDAGVSGFHRYEVATTTFGQGCRGPEISVTVLPTDTLIATGLLTDPADVTVAPAANTIFFLDNSIGGAITTDLDLVPTGQVSAVAPGSYSGIAYHDFGTPATTTDDRLYWLNETFGLLQVTDLAGSFIIEFSIASPTGGPLEGLDVADVDCGFDGLVARDTLSQTLFFFDFAGNLVANPIAISLVPGDVGSGVASIEGGEGFDVPLGSLPTRNIDRIVSLDCLGDASDVTSIGPGTVVPLPDVIALDLYLDAAGIGERGVFVTDSGDIITTGIEPRPCDDPDGLPCDLDLLAGCVSVNWSNPTPYTSIDVYRDATLLATLAGTATSYVDCPPVKAYYSYSIVPTCVSGAQIFPDEFCKVCIGDPDGKHRIANLDGGGGNQTADLLLAALEDLGEEGTFCTDLGNDDLSTAPAIWVLLGTFPDNHELTAVEGAALAAWHQFGIPIYLEGGDAWGFDRGTEFACYDGVEGGAVIDFGVTLQTIDGAEELVGISGPYTADQPTNDLLDTLSVTTSDLGGTDAHAIWTTSGVGAISTVGIAYLSTFAPVIVQSFELGGFGGDLDAVVEAYLGFLVGHGDTVFSRGDCNQDGGVDIGDAIFHLAALFSGGPASSCPDACDANDDGGIDIGDAIAILQHLFNNTGPLPPPNNCGFDTPDLGCVGGGCP